MQDTKQIAIVSNDPDLLRTERKDSRYSIKSRREIPNGWPWASLNHCKDVDHPGPSLGQNVG
ncbi:hypothetical protein HI914_04341 [Erysiphe necator]|nr:hypothetical protein HI914_04341 [Erysiphe necator]